MAKCRLGPKKIRRLEALTGRQVDAAFVRGGWPHGWAEVFFTGEQYTASSLAPPPMVNYHTGEFNPHGSPLYEEGFVVEPGCRMIDYDDDDESIDVLYFYYGYAGHRHKDVVGQNMEVSDLSQAEVEKLQERARRHIFTEMIPLPM